MPKKYEYKSDRAGDTRVRIRLSNEQYEALTKLAKRYRMETDDLLDRWIKRLIADRALP